jgi:predicted amidohydrolase
MNVLKALLVQARLRWQEPQRNRAHLESLLAATDADFDLAVFPETFTTGFLGDHDVPGEGMAGETVSWMVELAARHQAAIVGSAVIEEDGGRFNRMLFVTPDGVIGQYDKRHLFAFGGENQRYTAGRERVVMGFNGWRINLQICYDLRFPAWCRNRGDYDLMLLVANWPSRRVGHWSSLLEARAIENQSWVIGVNRVGKDGNGIRYPGCSVVHDPLGACTARLGDEEVCRLVELDHARVDEVRSALPFQADADDFKITL